MFRGLAVRGLAVRGLRPLLLRPDVPGAGARFNAPVHEHIVHENLKLRHAARGRLL